MITCSCNENFNSWVFKTLICLDCQQYITNKQYWKSLKCSMHLIVIENCYSTSDFFINEWLVLYMLTVWVQMMHSEWHTHTILSTLANENTMPILSQNLYGRKLQSALVVWIEKLILCSAEISVCPTLFTFFQGLYIIFKIPNHIQRNNSSNSIFYKHTISATSRLIWLEAENNRHIFRWMSNVIGQKTLNTLRTDDSDLSHLISTVESH